jgi:hypothetical protein
MILALTAMQDARSDDLQRWVLSVDPGWCIPWKPDMRPVYWQRQDALRIVQMVTKHHGLKSVKFLAIPFCLFKCSLPPECG